MEAGAPSCCSAISGILAEKAVASYMPNIAQEPFSAALARLDPAKPPGDRKRWPLGPVHSMQGEAIDVHHGGRG